MQENYWINDKLNKLNLKELMLMCEADFYSLIKNNGDLFNYLNSVHEKYCEKLNLKPIQLEVKDFKNSDGAFFDLGKKLPSSKIVFNNKIFDIFEECKIAGNKIFPYYALSLCLHETRHYYQAANIPNLNTNKLTLADNLSVAATKQTVLECKDIKLKSSKLTDNLNLIPYAAEIELRLNSLNEEYGNNPAELDANNSTLTELSNLYKETKSPFLGTVLISLSDDFFSRYNKGIWFLDNQYIKAKNGTILADKSIVKAYETSIKDFQNKKVEKYLKDKDAINDLSIEDYLLSNYKTLHELNNMKKCNYNGILKNNSEANNFKMIMENVNNLKQVNAKLK